LEPDDSCYSTGLVCNWVLGAEQACSWAPVAVPAQSAVVACRKKRKTKKRKSWWIYA
jgi:hypothetical protein